MQENKNIPTHVAIIMDGSDKWAQERNLTKYQGYNEGFKKIKIAAEWFFSFGVKYLSINVLTFDIWKMEESERNYLMKLVAKTLGEKLENFQDSGIKILISGRIDELPGDLSEVLRKTIFETRNNNRGILNICFNYNGKAEIVDAVKKIIEKKLLSEQINEALIKKYLYQDSLPDPDLIIRTSGSQNFSNFLLWQSSCANLIYLKKYWPEFEKQDVEKIIKNYGQISS